MKQDSLTLLYLDLKDLRKKKNTLASLQKSLKTKTLESDRLFETLNKEQKEYERMKNLSITSLFHSVIGNKQEKLEKEKA